MKAAVSIFSNARFDSTRMELLVSSGKHQQAKFVLKNNSVVLVGSGSDCDLILTDETISEQHCVLSVQNNVCCVKPLQGKVSINQQVINATQTLKATDRIQLADVTVALVQYQATTRPLKRFWQLPLFAGALLLPVFVMGMVGLAQIDLRTDAISQEQEEVVAQSPKPKKALNDDVRDILRLSGINADTEMVSDGVVRVTGHFGDGQQLASVMATRAIKEIAGLEKVIATNLDDLAETTTGNADAPVSVGSHRVAQVVSGDDPYLVMGDGSRFYPGATLPGGRQLADIRGQQIIISSREGEQMTIDGVGAIF